jgi:hypothetical protein
LRPQGTIVVISYAARLTARFDGYEC